MKNPYRSPAQIVLPSPFTFRWKRLLGWSVLIVVAVNLVGFLSGLAMAYWEIFGSTLEEAMANARLIRRIVIGIVGVLLYWRFVAGVAARCFLHVVALFVLVQLIEAAFDFLVFSVPPNDLIEPLATGRSLLAALAGLGIASLVANKSFAFQATQQEST